MTDMYEAMVTMLDVPYGHGIVKWQAGDDPEALEAIREQWGREMRPRVVEWRDGYVEYRESTAPPSGPFRLAVVLPVKNQAPAWLADAGVVVDRVGSAWRRGGSGRWYLSDGEAGHWSDTTLHDNCGPLTPLRWRDGRTALTAEQQETILTQIEKASTLLDGERGVIGAVLHDLHGHKGGAR